MSRLFRRPPPTDPFPQVEAPMAWRSWALEGKGNGGRRARPHPHPLESELIQGRRLVDSEGSGDDKGGMDGHGG